MKHIIKRSVVYLFYLSICCLSVLAYADTMHDAGLSISGQVIDVPAPTGVPATDHAAITAAVAIARAGDVVQFAAGRYVLGTESDFIVLTERGVTLRGATTGTTIFGGEIIPLWEEPPDPMGDDPFMHTECGGPVAPDCRNYSILNSPPRGFKLEASNVKVQNLTFMGLRTAIMLGFGANKENTGHRVSDCTFEELVFGIIGNVIGNSATRIEGNDFVNTNSPFDLSGSRYMVRNNSVTAPDPSRIPIDQKAHHAGLFAVGLDEPDPIEFNPFNPFWAEGGASQASGNEYAHNYVEGIAEGIQVFADVGGIFEHNRIQHNMFVRNFAWEDGDFGSSVLLLNLGGELKENQVLRNTTDGTDGFAMVSYGATDNMYIGNSIRAARIVGIYLMAGGDGNSLIMNNFQDTQPAVVVESNSNTIIMKDPNDEVLDFGEGNEIRGPGR